MTEFKRYKNRKIYNLKESNYATLESIAIESLSEEVRVSDNTSLNDVTVDTLLAGFTKLLDTDSKAQLVKLAQKLYLAKGLDQSLTDTPKVEEQRV
jgi:polyhydroxyalkanoate synthesis regulator protein